MPTADDLGALASALYVGNPSVGAYENVPNQDFDEESATAIALGLRPTFYLWSGEEHSSDHAYLRVFDSTFTGCLNGRYASGIHAVCLGG